MTVQRTLMVAVLTGAISAVQPSVSQAAESTHSEPSSGEHGEGGTHSDSHAEPAKEHTSGSSEHGHDDTADKPAEGEVVELAGPPRPPLKPILKFEDLPEPIRLVRSVRSLQDQLALGARAAASKMREIITHVAKRFKELDAEVWADPRNVYAAVVYSMSGGDPYILKKLLEEKATAGINEKLIDGIVAYAEGRQGRATEQLAEFDPRKEPATIAGHLALIKASLLTPTKPAEALALFDYARLVAPGTLIEESALRRQILLLASEGKHERFAALAHQYMRRFPVSAYARKFRRQLAAAVASKAEGNDLGWLPRLGGLIAAFKPEVQREVFLEIAKNAIANGKVGLARYAAANAAKLATDAPPDHQRSQVYEGSALILTDDFDAGVKALMGVDQKALQRTDGALLDAAFSVAREIRRWPEYYDEEMKEHPSEAMPSAANRAKQRLSEVDKLLGKEDP